MDGDVAGKLQREIVYDLLKTNLGHFSYWRDIESKLISELAGAPEPTTNDRIKKHCQALRNIKALIIDRGVPPSELSFLDEEIDRLDNTTQISIYTEEDDDIDRETLEKYAKMSYGTEGVIGIHHDFNFEQLKKLTNYVFEKTHLIKFFVSKEKTMYGKIVSELYEHPQEIPIATLCESKAYDRDTLLPKFKKVYLFGEKIDTTKVHIVRAPIRIPFHVYQFVNDQNKEFILFTTEQYSSGDYIITGCTTVCNDLKQLTDSAKLATTLPFFFAQQVKGRIIKYTSHEALFSRLQHLNWNMETTFNYPFSVFVKKRGGFVTLAHPEWFKWLIWGWLCHSRKGLKNEYPLHLLIIGDKGTGKSMLFNSLHAISKEMRNIFSGADSTIKFLVPSFKGTPAKNGYLAESNRFAFCDELLRCVMATSDQGNRDESLAAMNDLLEHQKREFGSGVSSARNINMTARVLAATNPPRGRKSVTDIVRALEESWLSRWLIYYQKEDSDHVRMIRNCEEKKLEPYFNTLPVDDFISVMDYCWTFDAKYDEDQLMRVFNLPQSVLSEELLAQYAPRHKHHLECLLDGIIKARCLFTGDDSFTATTEDYERLEMVWLKVIMSWVEDFDLKKLPLRFRVQYLPSASQYLFQEIKALNRPATEDDIVDISLRGIDRAEWYNALWPLRQSGLIVEVNKLTYPYYMSPLAADSDKQQRIGGEPNVDK